MNAVLDRHDEYIDAYTSWLLTSEGRASSSFVRAVINRVIVKHYDGKVEQAQFMQMQAMAAEAPAPAVQEKQANDQQQATAEAEDQGKAEMIEQAIGQQAMAEKDREHASKVKMSETEHAAQVEVMKAAAMKKVAPAPAK